MDELNLVKNPRFAHGKTTPRSWRWCADGEAARWTHEPSMNGRAERVMLIESDRADDSAIWTQTLRCRREQHYRLEADVACACHGTGRNSGLVLAVRSYGDEGPLGDDLRFAPVRQASEHLTLRGHFKTPAEARRLEIRIGMVQSSGWARVYDVRLMENLELDAASHVLAVPPPAGVEPPPCHVRRAVVCAEADACPTLLEVLRVRFGATQVKTRSVNQSGIQSLRTDAILIPGDEPPTGVRTIGQLEELAGKRVVVISLEAFARLSRPPLAIKTVEQKDDPLHAQVRCGCFITAGFAMQDVFPFAGSADGPSALAQRQFVTNRAFHDIRKRHGFEVFLAAVTDNDKTMDKPIGLYKQTHGGAVIVCDLAALELQPTTLNEANTTAALLLNMLGCAQSALGQYTAPARSERDFREELVDFSARYRDYTCLGIDRSESVVDGVAVRLGHDDELFGLPLPQRPAVVIRTGLRPGDEDGIYGTMLWLKRLVRPMPFPCGYTHYLSRRFRVFWLPLHRRWNDAIGLSPSEGSVRKAHGEFDPGATRMFVDVTVGSANGLRVVFGRGGKLFERCVRALPTLARAMDPSRFIAHVPAPDGLPGDFDTRAWRTLDIVPDVTVDGASFDDPQLRSALEAGIDVVRIEMPHGSTDLMADSIWRTDLVACTLEHVVGQACDGFVMNHMDQPLELDATDVLGESCERYHLVTTDPLTGENRVERCLAKDAPVVRLAPRTAVCK